jgi:hypothetical protein
VADVADDRWVSLQSHEVPETVVRLSEFSNSLANFARFLEVPQAVFEEIAVRVFHHDEVHEQ